MEEGNKKISTLEYKFWADNQEIDRDTPFYEKLRKIYEEEEIEEKEEQEALKKSHIMI